MAVLKLSQIAAAGSAPAASDQIVGVTTGTTDNLFSLTQINTSVLNTIGAAVGSAKITGGSSGNFFFNNAGVLGERTPTQATAALNLFTNTLQGLVSGSGGGTANFLRADDTWALPGLTVGSTAISGGANNELLFDSGPGTLQETTGITTPGTGQLVVALGTITTNLKAISITGTWNAVGTTFDAPLLVNITPTASAAGSSLVDIQQAGVSQLALFNRTASTASPVLAIGNSTNATQTFVYNTVDTLSNPTNYERFAVDWVTNSPSVTVGTQASGTGTLRNILIRTPNNQGITIGGNSSQNIYGASRHSLSAGNAWEYIGVGLTLANGLNSNISTGGAFAVITGPSGGFSVGGFSFNGTNSGTRLFLYNSTAQQMTIVNADASSSASNRILTLTGANVVLRAGPSFAQFIYDGQVANQWILVATN